MPSRLSTRALWGLLGWLLPLLVVFLVTPELLRALGADAFGVLMTVLIIPLLSVTFDFGLLALGTRRVSILLTSGKVDAAGTLLRLVAAFVAIGTLWGSVIALASRPLAEALGFDSALGSVGASNLLRMSALWFAISLMASVPILVARAAQQLAWLAGVQTLSTIALWLGALVMAQSQQPLSNIVGLGIVLTIASSLVTLIAMRKHIDWRSRVMPGRSMLTNDRNFAAGTFAAQLAGGLVFQGDRIIVAWLGSPALAGAYALCVNVTNKTLAAIVAATSFVFPHAAALEAQRDRAQIERLSHSLDRAIVVMVAPILAPGLALAEVFLSLWLGDFSSIPLVRTFQILLIAFSIPAFAVPMSYFLAAVGNATLPALFSTLSALVLLAAMLLLVPPYGLQGAATATLCSMMTSPLFNWTARRRLNLPKGAGRIRFWSGISCGIGAQIVLLLALADTVSSWIGLFALALAVWLIFYLTRAAFQLLSPEEASLIRRGLAIIYDRKRTP